MGIILKEEQSGFTIIEVMLFLALTGFLMAGILAGAGSSIANQRYKDAIQDAAEAIRKAYSFVADTQIELRDGNESACDSLINNIASGISGEAGRGRTSCAVYGAVVSINKDIIQTTTLVGRDYYDATMNADNVTECGEDDERVYCKLKDPSLTDIQILTALEANNLFRNTTVNRTYVAGNSATRTLKWGAYFREPIDADSGEEKGADIKLTLLIFRSPRDGSIRTLVMNDLIKNGDDWIDYRNIGSEVDAKQFGVYQYIENDAFTAQNVYLCVDSGGAESYGDRARMIRITKNAHSQSGVKLEDFDATIIDPDNNEEVLCDKN